MKFFFFACLFFLLTSFAPRNKSWVAIGDSITYLNDHLTETGNRVTKGYLTRVTDKLPQLNVTNQGHNGWTAGGIADSINTLGIMKADVYTIFLGTNDWWAGRPIGTLNDYQNNSGNNTVYGSFRIIINKMRELNKNAKVILITPMQRADFVYILDPNNNAWGSYKEKNGQSLASVAAAVDSIARYEHIDVIDLYHDSSLMLPNLVKFKRLKDPQTGEYRNYPYPDYTGVPFDPKKDEYPYPEDAVGYTYDGLHPSDRGNEVIAEKLVALLQK